MEEVKGRGDSGVAAVRPARAVRPDFAAADARADQPARAGTADRRAVFEVTRSSTNFEVDRRSVAIRQSSARSSQTCSGRPVTQPAGLVSPKLTEGGRRRTEAKGTTDVVEGFSAAEAVGVRARDVDGSVRAVLRPAVRARVRHDGRQRDAARAAVVDRGRGGDGGEDRGRAARVLARSRAWSRTRPTSSSI